MSAQRRPPDVDDEFLTVAEVARDLKAQSADDSELDRSGSLAALRVGCCRLR
jgi:hypothetical protein